MSREADDVTVQDGYVLVTSRRTPDVESARRLCEAVDAALAESGYRAVLFDTRETEAPQEDVRHTMWEWTQAARNFDRAAIVAQSELTRVSANMTALSRGVRLKAFSSIEDAAAWLTR